MACLTGIKAWLSLNFLNFNESKMEIIIFGPSDSLNAPKINLGGLTVLCEARVKNLVVVFNKPLKSDMLKNMLKHPCLVFYCYFTVLLF